jgi:hypothetical protein
MSRSTKRLGVMLGAMALLSLASMSWAEDKKEGPGEKKTCDKCQCACTIDFQAAFELPFEGLCTMGTRIDQARKSCDPVCLCCCANELGCAEKVSGKKASITSADLHKECIEMAKRRGSSVELKAVAYLLKDKAASDDLEKQAAKASEREENEIKEAKEGKKAKGIGTLSVRNFTNYKIWIYVNDRRVGWVNPYGEYSYHIGQPSWMTTKLFGLSDCGTRKWGPTYFAEDYSTYTWSLYP